uniref:Uncharacterized protein n=1 Tax=Arundo donax TaxID=35708 RepID=A0A0A9EE42_ARUDO
MPKASNMVSVTTFKTSTMMRCVIRKLELQICGQVDLPAAFSFIWQTQAKSLCSCFEITSSTNTPV